MADTHPLVGRTVAGRFRLTRVLGEGGMATVFVAEQDAQPREIALKVMNEELTRERSFVRRFEREAKAASLVVHPNSVRIFAWGVAEGVSYIAMELVRGRDLYEVLEHEGPLSQKRVALVLAAVCDALEVAHGLGIVHRDLKPENVMLVDDPGAPGGEGVKVLDFGIAKLVAPDLVAAERRQHRTDTDPGSNLTQAGTLIGTPAYMSPEQCKLEAVDARSDVYTCGVLMYQLLTGELPFSGESPLHTAMLHIHEALRPPSALAPDLDPRLDAIVVRALTKDPAARYQTAGDLARTLRDIAPTLPSRPAVAAGSNRPVSSRPQRAASNPSSGQPAVTPRWTRDKKGGDDGATELESQRTLVADGLATTPASVRFHKGPRPPRPAGGQTAAMPEQPTGDLDAEGELEVPSSDENDRARTLVREHDDSAISTPPVAAARATAKGLGIPPGAVAMPPRRSGPQGTEVIDLPSKNGDAARKRELNPTLQSANVGFGVASNLAAGGAVEVRVADEPTADPITGVAAPDVDSHLATQPMGIKRPPLGRGHTVPVQIAHNVVPTLEIHDRPPMVAPFPIGARRGAGTSLAHMSGTRVLLLGFLAGAILTGILAIVYFFVLR